MSQPLDRTKRIKELGPLDRELGEFWVENPFLMPQLGENLSAYETNCLYLNHGDFKFVEGSFASSADLDADSRSIAPADFDRDGKVDLLVGSVGGGPLRMFRNEFQDAHWIGLQFRGSDSNSQGIGARIKIQVDGRTLHRELFPANGFFGSSPSELHIGLGQATQIDSIEIRWPSGHVTQMEDVTADQWLKVFEDERPAEPVKTP